MDVELDRFFVVLVSKFDCGGELKRYELVVSCDNYNCELSARYGTLLKVQCILLDALSLSVLSTEETRLSQLLLLSSSGDDSDMVTMYVWIYYECIDIDTVDDNNHVVPTCGDEVSVRFQLNWKNLSF